MRMGVPFLPALPASTRSKGPTANATRYDGSGFVSSKRTAFIPPGSAVSAATGVLESAVSPSRTWSVSCQGTLYEGSSKQGKARRASMLSNWVKT